MPAASLLDRRFIILSGKGGVGRTTLGAVLARVASRAGKRVLLAQMQSSDRLGRLLGHPQPIGPEVAAVAEGLDVVNMTPARALHQYGLMVLRYETVYRALFDNKAVRTFLGAIPGLHAYAMLGKVWWHTTEQHHGAPKYDLVILDGPASGHLVTLLKIPGAILSAMPKGPLARDAGAMAALLAHLRNTAHVIVTLAEDLPARETTVLARQIGQELKFPLGPLVVNNLPPERFGSAAVAKISTHLPLPTGDPALDETLSAAALLVHRRRYAEDILAGLRNDPGLPIIELPALPTTDLGPPEVDELAAVLHAQLYSKISSA